MLQLLLKSVYSVFQINQQYGLVFLRQHPLLTELFGEHFSILYSFPLLPRASWAASVTAAMDHTHSSLRPVLVHLCQSVAAEMGSGWQDPRLPSVQPLRKVLAQYSAVGQGATAPGSAVPTLALMMRHEWSSCLPYTKHFFASGPPAELTVLFYERGIGPVISHFLKYSWAFTLVHPYNTQHWFSKWGPQTISISSTCN